MSIGKRIKELRENLGDSIDRFSVKTRVSRAAIVYYESDKHDPKFSFLQDVICATGVSPVWLMLGEGQMFMGADAAADWIAEMSSPKPVLIPVLGRIEAGPNGGFLPGTADYYIHCPAGVECAKAFGFEIHGESMVPRYRNGDIVICTRKADIRIDDDAVVQLAWGETVCKIWRHLGDTIILESWNPAFKPIEVKPDKVLDKAKVIGLVWGSLAQVQRVETAKVEAARKRG